MSSVLCIIQARLGSTRLPGKALMDIGGIPMIAQVVGRVRQCRVEHICVAVPHGEAKAFAWLVNDARVSVMEARPSVAEADVLARFHQALAIYSCAYPVETVVRVTADCPLLSPTIAEQVLALYRDTTGCEYASNVAPGYVDGTDVEVFSAEALRLAHREATKAEDREHVTPWILRHVKTATLLPESPSTLKTSVDTLEDLERVRALMVAA